MNDTHSSAFIHRLFRPSAGAEAPEKFLLRPGLEPQTSRLADKCNNHSSTMHHKSDEASVEGHPYITYARESYLQTPSPVASLHFW